MEIVSPFFDLLFGDSSLEFKVPNICTAICGPVVLVYGTKRMD